MSGSFYPNNQNKPAGRVIKSGKRPVVESIKSSSRDEKIALFCWLAEDLSHGSEELSDVVSTKLLSSLYMQSNLCVYAILLMCISCISVHLFSLGYLVIKGFHEPAPFMWLGGSFTTTTVAGMRYLDNISHRANRQLSQHTSENKTKLTKQ